MSKKIVLASRVPPMPLLVLHCQAPFPAVALKDCSLAYVKYRLFLIDLEP